MHSRVRSVKLLELLVELSRGALLGRLKDEEVVLLEILPTTAGGTHAGGVSTRASLVSSRDEAGAGCQSFLPATGGFGELSSGDMDGQLALPVGWPTAK